MNTTNTQTTYTTDTQLVIFASQMAKQAGSRKRSSTSTLIPCPVGCDEQMPVEEVNDHLSNGVSTHLMTLSRRVNQVGEQLFAARSDVQQRSSIGGAAVGRASTVSDVQRDIDRLKRTQSDIQRQLEELENRTTGSETQTSSGAIGGAATTTTYDDVIARLGIVEQKSAQYDKVVVILVRELERCHRRLEEYERMQRSERTLFEEQDKKCQTLERKITNMETSLKEHSSQLDALSLSSYTGTLIWRVGNFSNRRQDAISGRVTSFYSPIFYTGRTGYKMCARIYLNGDGMGKGTHISIFFVLMRGEYDALLQWPFRQKVTMILLDHTNREHIVDAFRPDPTSSSFKKPTGDMNVASGCPLFMPLTTLDAHGNQYVIDNAVFIKIIIDRNGLDH